MKSTKKSNIVNLKDRLRRIGYKYYFTSLIMLIIIFLTFTFVIVNFVIIPTLKNIISKNVIYTFQILRDKIVEFQSSLFPILRKTLEDISSQIDEGKIKLTKKDLNKAFERYREEIKKINYISGVDYYIIDKDGKIYMTSYPPDLGLDLSKFEEIWKKLNDLLSNEEYVIQPFAFESVTGKGRVYAYKRLKNSDILEIGIEISKSFLEDQLGAVTKLRDGEIIKDVNLYNITFKPFGEIFKPICEEEAKFFIKKLKNQEDYLEGLYGLRKRLVVKTEVTLFGNLKQPAYIIVDLDFTYIYFLSIVVISIIVFILMILSVRTTQRFSGEVVKQFNILKDLIISYNPMEPKLDGIEKAFQTDILEFREVLQTFQEMAERISADMQEMKALNEELEDSYMVIEEKSNELEQAFLDFSEKLALIAEGHDKTMKLHLKRVKELTSLILNEMDDLPEKFKEEIINYSILHDIGKVFIPAGILNKSDKLTKEEWELVKKHTIYAGKLLGHPKFKIALNIAMYHHENYDGTGYPYGLKDDEIPMEAQIIKIVDIYDALRSERPYKKAYTHEEAMRIILEGDGRTEPEHFNPRILKIFQRVSKKVKEIYERGEDDLS